MKRFIVSSLILVGLVGGAGAATRSSATASEGDDREWMQGLTEDAETLGYAVTGLSPTSIRFIPTTPWAAHIRRPK